MFKKGIVFSLIFLLSGCAVKYSEVRPNISEFDQPKVGEVTTAQVGDELLRKGMIVEEEVVYIPSTVSGVLYNIHVGEYPLLGVTSEERFYSPIGVTRGALADPFQAISVKNDNQNQICVVTSYGIRSCYDAKIEIKKRASVYAPSFVQTLLYSGRVGNKVNISYREFSNSTARPAFNNDVEYDLSDSNQIGYKGALIEIIKADNSGITYKVLKSFK